MSWSLKELANRIDADVEGDSTIRIGQLTALQEGSAEALAPFFRKSALPQTGPMPIAVLTRPQLRGAAHEAGIFNLLIHPHPEEALLLLMDLFFPTQAEPVGIHPSATVHPKSHIHISAWIGPGAVVEQNVNIGPLCRIGPRAVICAGTTLHKAVIIGPGAVIGYEGFGFLPTSDIPRKVPQVGGVVLEDNVEVGANSCIDRGTLGVTRIGRGTKIDNLVQVGHNSNIGSGVMICGQAGLAGSVTIEDNVMIGGNAGVADHVTIGKGAMVAAKSGVIGNVRPGAVVAGYPAMYRNRWRRTWAMAARQAAPKNTSPS